MEGLSAVVAGSGNSWAGRAKVRFYLKWRDSALLSMEVEAVGRRRAEGTFSLFCIILYTVLSDLPTFNLSHLL